MNLVKNVLSGLACILLSGCVIPATKHAAVSGHVLDSATGKPIENALVEYPGFPRMSTLTDGRGYFKLPEVKGKIFVLVPLGDIFPPTEIKVSAQSYLELTTQTNYLDRPVKISLEKGK